MICQNCGQENLAEAALCKNCGATIARRTLASPASSPLAPLAGLVTGVFMTGCLWLGGAFVFSRVGATPNVEYTVSQGSAWFYVATLPVTCAALVVLFLRPTVARMNGNLRAFLLAALFVLLGGMSFCSFLTSSSLFAKA